MCFSQPIFPASCFLGASSKATIIYGFSAGKLNELLLVKKDAFFNKRAEDSDICKSFITDLGGAFVLALLMSGVMPFVIRCNIKQKIMYKSRKICEITPIQKHSLRI